MTLSARSSEASGAAGPQYPLAELFNVGHVLSLDSQASCVVHRRGAWVLILVDSKTQVLLAWATTHHVKLGFLVLFWNCGLLSLFHQWRRLLVGKRNRQKVEAGN